MFRGRDFRKCYGQLGNIRDAMGPTIPWFVTSATMPTAQRRSILESIHIIDAVEIDENLNRPELYYNIIQSHIGDKFRGGGSTPVDHVVEELDPVTKKPVKKTLIYFDSIATLGCILFHLRRLLVVAGYPSASVKHVVQGYFSDRTPGAKSRVYRAFLDGRCMIVCATEAFGMGMDIPDIDGVYNWGIPRSLSSLIQRFGRGARGKYRTATCTLILPQYCKDIIRPPHPESIDVPNDQSPEVQVSHESGDIINSNQTQSRPPTKPKNKKDPKTTGEHANLLALKRRSPDLYDFLNHYCLRKAVMEHLNGVDAEYTAITAGPCCSLCSQARYHNMHNQHDANSMGPRGYSGLAQTIPIQKKKKARYTRPFIRAIIIESLNEWRAEVLDLLWKEKDPFAIEEMIATDEIIESIAKQAWMLVEDDQLPIPSLCAWGTFQRFRNFIPDKPVASVIVSSFHKGSEMWKDSQSKKKEKTLLSKQKNRLEAARGRPLQRGSLGQSSRSIGRRDSSQESVTSEVGMVDEEEEQLEDQNEAIDQAADV
jgi:helicase-like protein